MFSLLGSLRLHHVSSGLVAVLVGYTSSAALIFQAAQQAGASPAQLGSWLGALGLGTGLTTLGLSLRYRTPILTAWSTPGAALLISSLAGLSLAEAVGAFIVSSALISLVGFSGLFARLMHRLPQSLAAAMLGGVLLGFCLELFRALPQAPWLVGSMLLGYWLLKPRLPRYAIGLVLLIGLAVALGQGDLNGAELALGGLRLEWVSPAFSWHACLGVALPLFLVTMSSQNLPGLATLHAHGYRPPVSPLIGWTGLAGLLLAPFGGFALNLAAITAALCMGKEADPEPHRRYLAACCAGVFYLLTALLGSTVASLFALLPRELIVAIAGLALLGTLGGSLKQALEVESEREAALITLLVTAAGVSFFGIGAPFWGLLAGVLTGLCARRGWLPWGRKALRMPVMPSAES